MKKMEELLAKYFSGNTSEEESDRVKKFKLENPEEFFEWKRTWALTTNVKTDPDKLTSIISNDSESKVIPLWSSWMKYAAVVALLVASAAVVFIVSRDTPETDLIKYQKLSDGSRVVLYKNASLEEVDFSDKRVVNVEGRVFFDVKRDEQKPFIIFTNEAKIEVLGTSFTVDTDEENTTEVIVETGTVAFSQNPETFKGNLTVITLEAGEMGKIMPNARGLIKQDNRDENYLAWANQILTFERTRLGEVAELMNEVYGYQLEFENTDLSKCSLTATYRKKSPEQIVRLIAETFGLEYEITGNIISFSGEGC